MCSEEKVNCPKKSATVDSNFDTWSVGHRYKLCRLLGRGSYGVVAEAIDLSTNCKVAIKRIQNIFDQKTGAKRMCREIRILRSVKHPHTVRLLNIICPGLENVYSCGDVDGTSKPISPNDPVRDGSFLSGASVPTEAQNRARSDAPILIKEEHINDLYLVMEFVDTDLYKLLNSAQFLSTDHIKTFMHQILLGLKFLHSSNIIHRDIKPANVLLHEDCTLKICDFGLSRVVPKERIVVGPKRVPYHPSPNTKTANDGLPKIFRTNYSGSSSGDSTWGGSSGSCGSLNSSCLDGTVDEYSIAAPSSSGAIQRCSSGDSKENSSSPDSLALAADVVGVGEKGGACTSGQGSISTGSVCVSTSVPLILPAEGPDIRDCTRGIKRRRVHKGSAYSVASGQDSQTRPEKKLHISCISDNNSLSGNNDNGQVSQRVLSRQLTRHVVTRWYRPPEVILLQQYTSAVDIWSAGCILAELLGMQEESVPFWKDRVPLFPGKSCYPLSWDHTNELKQAQALDIDGIGCAEVTVVADGASNLRSYSVKVMDAKASPREVRMDQLNIIFEIIGTPQEADLQYINDENTKMFLRQRAQSQPMVRSTSHPHSYSNDLSLFLWLYSLSSSFPPSFLTLVLKLEMHDK
jgi:serine/threonine protein kinase